MELNRFKNSIKVGAETQKTKTEGFVFLGVFCLFFLFNFILVCMPAAAALAITKAIALCLHSQVLPYFA